MQVAASDVRQIRFAVFPPGVVDVESRRLSTRKSSKWQWGTKERRSKPIFDDASRTADFTLDRANRFVARHDARVRQRAVSCYGAYKACFVASVEQIGRDQIGRMQNAAAYPIVKMNQYEVVAQEEASLFGCFRVTITIDRKAEQLLWVEEPINQTKPNCKDADTTIRKYSIEDSPRWKQWKQIR